MNRTIIVLLALTLSIVAAGCASNLHHEYSPLDEHDDAIFAEEDADAVACPMGDGVEDVSAESTEERPALEQPSAEPTPVVEPVVAKPKPEEDPNYRAEVRRRQKEKQRRAAEQQALQELTGGK